MTIHSTAIIASEAIIADSAEIGPYAVIGSQVSIGSGSKVGAHVVIDGQTSIGENCQIFSGASVGQAPQSISYKGEPAAVKIGNGVTIREYATVHRGLAGGCTTIGDQCYIMNYAHIAHDCQLGQGVIMANSATLAGHVTVGDSTVMAGVCVFHQYVRIGRLCMVSGMTGSRMDLPPFVILDGLPPAIRGLNLVGMKRHGFSLAARMAIKRAYKILYHSGLNYTQAIKQIEQEEVPPEVQEIIDFFTSSKRGVIGAYYENEALPDEKTIDTDPLSPRNVIEIKV
jgi:UDP-N-acetylglucosamine acyltransferase